MTNLPHFVQYQGSKRTLAKRILPFFPKKITRLVEPFAGSAAISIATSANQIADRFWLNDLNQPLIELLELAIETPEELADFYQQLWNQQHDDSIDHYFNMRSKFNETKDPRLFLYLLARCVKGSVRYNSEGCFNQSPDKRRKGTRPETMRNNIRRVSSLLRGKSKFTSLDYREVLEQTQDSDFIYMDPPYQGVCGSKDSRYSSGVDYNSFILAIEKLNHKKALFAISYDGRLGNKSFGAVLPEYLNLKRIEIEVGRSSQSTLLGRKEITIESLYLSSRLAETVITKDLSYICKSPKQLMLLREDAEFTAISR